MAGLKPFLKQRVRALCWLACGAVVAFFAWSLAFFYIPGQGFTCLVQVGDKLHARLLPELKAVGHYEQPDSWGYDGQFYAQIAMRPRLGDPGLAASVDGLIYRARRILCPVASWALAGGDPGRALAVYSVLNIACWLALALLLLRWFPPTGGENVARWTAVLFSFGLIFSVVRAMPDLPALLILAGGMALLESGRPWLAAVVLGVGGLAKDTTVIAACGLGVSRDAGRSPWRRWNLQAALVVLPLAAWMIWLRILLGHGDDIGARNFAAPFCALAQKAVQSIAQVGAEGRHSVASLDLMVLAGLATQFLFFVLRRRWGDPWWRVGAGYSVLMVVLGDAVWEGYPSAGARVLLPMTLCFNVLLPRGRRWLPLLVLGNLGVFASLDLLKPPGRESCLIEGPAQLRINPGDGSTVQAVFGPVNWWRPERSRFEYWRWGLGDASVTLHNPQPFALQADLHFQLRADDAREAVVGQGSSVLWRGMLEPGDSREVSLPGLVLPPGDSVLTFRSDRPGAFPGNGDRRKLTFSLRDLVIDLTGRR